MFDKINTRIGNKDLSISSIVSGLLFSFAFLWILLIALAWTAEEPGKMQTILVIFTVFILGVIIIKYAKKIGVIKNEKLWIFIFLVKLTFVAIILQYLWIPAFPAHRAPGPAFDPLVFDYYGKILAENNLNSNVIYQVYNYVGQIYYIGLIYWLFGVSTLYVGLFNTLLSLVSFLAVTALLVNCAENKKNWSLMSLGMLFPELLYYDAIPSKEVIATCMIALSILFMYKFSHEQKPKYLVFLLLVLSILISVRAVMALVVIAIWGISVVLKYKHKLKWVFLYSGISLFMLLFSFPYIIKYTGGTPATVGTFLNLSERSKYGIKITPGEKSLSVMFATDNPIKAIVFAPIRTIFLLVAPFPRLGIDWTDATWISSFTRFSVWIILLSFPILIAATFQKSCRTNPSWFYVVFVYWLLLLFIANGALIIHERYRIMADPFLAGTLLVGVKYGNPGKFVLLSILLIAFGFIAYYVLK